MKTLIVFLHGIGDSIMFTPALRKYKEKYPEKDIYLLTLKLTVSFWEKCPYLKKVLISKRNEPPHYGNPLKYIPERQELQKEIETIMHRERIDEIEFIVPWSFRLGNYSIPIPGVLRRLPGVSAVEDPEVIVLAKRLGVYNGEKKEKLKQEIYGKEETPKRVEDFLKKEKIPKRFAILHSEASSKNKSLTEQEEDMVIAHLQQRGIWTVVLQKEKMGLGVIGFKATNLLESIALIKKCTLFIGIDSGPAHIAEGLQRPSIIISKAFAPELLYTPNKKIRILRNVSSNDIERMMDQLV